MYARKKVVPPEDLGLVTKQGILLRDFVVSSGHNER